MTTDNSVKALLPDFERACALAARACLPWVGQGDKEAADAAAVDAMRTAFNAAPMHGRIVIGEGERDQAPMLYIGETLGNGPRLASTPEVDIAVDPLEGTTLCAQNRPGALCVAAFAPRGELLHAPDVYMQKIAARPGLDLRADDLDRPLDEVLARLQGQAGRPLRVIMLDRDRHRPMMAAVQAAGAALRARNITILAEANARRQHQRRRQHWQYFPAITIKQPPGAKPRWTTVGRNGRPTPSPTEPTEMVPTPPPYRPQQLDPGKCHICGRNIPLNRGATVQFQQTAL